MITKKRIFLVMSVLIFFMLVMVIQEVWAQPKVYLKSPSKIEKKIYACPGKNVAVSIYGDNFDKVGSFGVSLAIGDTAIAKIANATKNTNIWKMDIYTTPNPEFTDGEAIIIGGKLDPTDPLSGVSGNNILLGNVTLQGIAKGKTNIAIALGQPPPFQNFVKIDDGTELDTQIIFEGASEINVCKEPGDANADGYITSADLMAVRNLMTSGGYTCCADCNQDGYITAADLMCIRSKM